MRAVSTIDRSDKKSSLFSLATTKRIIFHADEITLIGQLVKKGWSKISRADEIRAATLFSFGYLIKIV